jgi:hypothetical protein
MKNQIFWGIALAGLLLGCAETHRHMGASGEGQPYVLSGGPVTGATISDLPEPVRAALQKQVPSWVIADIDEQNQDGAIVYKISFAKPGKHPSLYVTEDGKIIQPHTPRQTLELGKSK